MLNQALERRQRPWPDPQTTLHESYRAVRLR
jgi:hypothetical protein